MTKKIKLFLEKFINSLSHYYFRIRSVEDLPENLEDRIIYIIGIKEYKWLLGFKCPCGCKEIIYLNILKNVKPSWSFKIKGQKITIYPSIKREVGCHCHFHVVKSKVYWVVDY